MEFRLPTPKQLVLAYERDLKAAFPKAELKPLAGIQEKQQAGRYLPWCFFDGEELVGECFLWLGHPGWNLLDYLCVSAARRSGGLGARMLAELRRTFPGEVFFGESEAPADAPDPAMAERRLGFYARCGLRTAGYDTEMFGVHYKTLYLAEEAVPDAQLMAEHDYVYRRDFSPEKFARYVRIPWNPAAPTAQVPWNE